MHFPTRRAFTPPNTTAARSRTWMALALAVVLGATSAAADDFEVTRTDDPVPDGCVSGVDCSLREAVIDAIDLAGDDRVLLAPETYTLTLVGADEDLGATGDLDCSDFGGDLELRGLGATPADTVIDATGLGDRILDLLSCDVRILDLTMRGGNVADGGGAIRSVREITIRRVVFEDNTAGSDGGAIHASGRTGRVTIEDSAFRDNRATRAGAILNEFESTVVVARSSFTGNVTTGRGGAIYNEDEAAFTLIDSHLENNRSEDAGNGRDGGAIFTQNSSSFTIVRSTIVGNLAEEAGGAIFVQNDSALTIVESTLRGNQALGTEDFDGGGAIYCNNDSALIIERSTLSGNHSEGDAGAISRNNDGQLLMRNSTVSGNTAGRNGGGLVFDSFGGSGHVAIESSTITDNSAGGQGGGVWHEGDPAIESSFLSTILSGNFAAGVPNDCDTDGVGVFVSKGFNLDGTGTCGLDQATDLPGADPMLGPLADNGGPTRTHALLDGSFALDTGWPNPLDPMIDQRSVARPQGAAPDIGAFEFVEPEPAENVCQSTADAIEVWKEEVPVAACSDSDDSDKVCRAWVKTCKRLVKAAAECRTTDLGNIATLDKAECRVSDGDVQQCSADVLAEFKLAKAATKTDKLAGLTACDEFATECRTICEGASVSDR